MLYASIRPTWSQDIDQALAAPLDYENIMYVLHFYAATHTDWLRERMKTCIESGLPVFVSEFGICDASGNGAVDIAQGDAWKELIEAYNISYLCWNLANTIAKLYFSARYSGTQFSAQPV